MDYFTLQPGFYFEIYNLMAMSVIGLFSSYEACEIVREGQVLFDTLQNAVAGTDTTLVTSECWEWILTEEI